MPRIFGAVFRFAVVLLLKVLFASIWKGGQTGTGYFDGFFNISTFIPTFYSNNISPYHLVTSFLSAPPSTKKKNSSYFVPLGS